MRLDDLGVVVLKPRRLVHVALLGVVANKPRRLVNVAVNLQQAKIVPRKNRTNSR